MAQRGYSPRYRPSPLEQRISLEYTLSFPNNSSSSSSSSSNNKQQQEQSSPSSSSLTFPNPIGLAAGFDKDGQAIQPLLDMGFGSVEVGTVTPQPQPGNPKPRMFRLVDDYGIINRYGFNSQGADQVAENVKAFRRQTAATTAAAAAGPTKEKKEPITTNTTNNNNSKSGSGVIIAALESIWSNLLQQQQSPPRHRGLLGINIGKNKLTVDAKIDYVSNILKLGEFSDYIVINISSPNTPNLRDLQKADAISDLVQACLEARDQLVLKTTRTKKQKFVPLFVKIAPDLSYEELESMVPTLQKVDGVVVTNTTNQRPTNLVSNSQLVQEVGGLSGSPLKNRSTEMIRQLYELMEGNVFIIGVGGIGNGQDAYEKLKAGASVLQIYSMLIYNGPGCVSKIRHELAEIMDQNGHRTLLDVIGRDHEEIFWKKQRQRRRQQQQ